MRPKQSALSKIVPDLFFILGAVLGLVLVVLRIEPVQAAGTYQNDCPFGTYPGNEAPYSTISLQMPVAPGSNWVVGGGGSFYGNFFHCNSYNDHYATDWNLANGVQDAGKPVLAIADGLVTSAACPTGDGYGCNVVIAHAGGYSTRYAHMQIFYPSANSTVVAGQVIGLVGNTGTNSPHLHLSFLRNNTSYCASGCPAGEVPTAPQGVKPSRMQTTSGLVNLTDGSTYASVNGRQYLPDLRSVDGWPVAIYVRNTTGQDATASMVYRDLAGTNSCSTTVAIPALSMRRFIPSCSGFSVASGTLDAPPGVTVMVLNNRTTPLTRGATPGIVGARTVSGSSPWTTAYVPMVVNGDTSSGVSSTVIVVQNATSQATTVSVNYINSPGYSAINPNPKTYSLPANATIRINDVPNPWSGAAVVSTAANDNTAVAVTVDYFAWNGLTLSNVEAFQSSSAGTNWTIPLFMSRLPTGTGIMSTPIVVQNVSGQTINVGEISLYCTRAPGWATPPATLSLSNAQAVSNNGSYAFNPVTDLTNFPSNWWGSCTLSVYNQKSVLMLMQSRAFASGGQPTNYNAYAYQGLRSQGSGGGGTYAFFPFMAKALANGTATSVVIQNLNTSQSANVTFYYKAEPTICPGSTDVTVANVSIPASQSVSHSHRSQATIFPGLTEGWCGSLLVKSLNGVPVDGFAEVTTWNSNAGDNISAYNAFTTKWYYNPP